MRRFIVIVGALALSPAAFAGVPLPDLSIQAPELPPSLLYAPPLAVVAPELPPAALPVLDDGAELEVIAQLVLHAVSTSNWRALAALAVVVLVWLVRRYGGKQVPWLLTPRGGATLVLIFSIAGAVANALLAGAPLSLALLLDATITGALATGARKLLLAAATPAPDPIRVAELAGAKAAAAVQPRSPADIANGR
ncbi:MAG: hypothetical protein ACK4N5_09785 [Myxococcales bacterium]